ncbi:putative sodium-coupled neutral amino acid transporter 11 [Platichthys flesus]|uniref:putative sodium-coupled neutral amino acid transporter 11 n=1 Tax=Platichthys flesus TaxID=8260 RepID=UPI002DB8A2FE|nr:putative sodium-coupled neutral amino acid transporter 11 [Platichthys flesus]
MAQQLPHEEGTMLIHPQKYASGARRSTTSATFNFINSIIGSGIIGLPYALNQEGLPLGVLLLIIVALIIDYSIVLLIRGGNLSGKNSYQSLVQSTFGFPGFLIVSALQFLYPFIAMVSYNITTGDTMTKVFQRIPGVGLGHILAERHFVILLSTLAFTLPLSLYRNIEKLGNVSFLSMVLTLTILIVVIIIRAATLGPQILPTENAWAFAERNAIQEIGVMSFAFICHHNSFLIYGSLDQPTLANWSQVTHVSVRSALVISAVAGYTTFTGFTQGINTTCRIPYASETSYYNFSGDIFENNGRDDNLATFGRFCFGFSIITTFPLECFVTREGALSTIPLIFIIPSACILKLSPGRWYQGENLIATIL